MTKEPMKIIFRDAIHFVTYTFITKDWDSFSKEVRKQFPDYKEDIKDGKTISITGRESFVFIFLKKFDVPTLAHEAVHATNAVFDSIGSEFGMKTDEHFAYYVQWIVGTIYHNRKKGI